MNIYIGADHRGYKLKKALYEWLVNKRYAVVDMGAYIHDGKDDYTLYAEKVGSLVAHEHAMGILICGSGVGINVAANKIDGVRASLGLNPQQVKAGRKDDDMNVLVLASDFVSERSAKKMVEVFIKGMFDKKDRHVRRLTDIERMEENN